MLNIAFVSILAGLISSLALLSVLSGSILAFPIFYLAPVPIYFVGLTIGAKGLLVAGTSGLIVSFALGEIIATIPFLAACVLPAFIVCTCFLIQRPSSNSKSEWHAAGEAVAYLTALGGILLFVVCLIAETTKGFEPLVVDHLSEALTSMVPNLPQNIHNTTIASLSPFFPGVAVASWIVMNIANAAIAQWASVRMKKNLRPTPSYSNVSMPQWLSTVFVGACILALLGPNNWGYLGNNLALVLAIPFFFVGLAVVHKFLGKQKHASTMIALFYVVLLVSSWASFLVAVLGIIEQWFGWAWVSRIVTYPRNKE
ncbi:MAG: hypothetical protein CFH06_01420 [Alphaproteobacteria bacterium MarineAlpha3_Bin5]|nr:hypothetical protein [Magnetovibrio sp.]PPR77178.1 MAG: hypothetical protein CFH06_01420 [Alphaproteobacteria bacterium MarineAlpha3_Bin5]